MEIKDFKHSYEYAVIINCGTRLSTTLAIFSALKHLNMPLIVVDCPPPPSEEGKSQISDIDYLKQLKEHINPTCDFNLISMPLRKHGATLDYIFTNLSADFICLIDSDLEILNDSAIRWMREYVKLPNVFGSGFIHGPLNRFLNIQNGYYAERMWIPFTLLNVKHIREQIRSGSSFNIEKRWNDFPISQYISKKCYKYVTSKYNIYNPFRKRFGDTKPVCALFDTGANIYFELTKKGLVFAGPKTTVFNLYVNHFDGITRNRLNNSDFTGKSLNSVSRQIERRLKDIYDFDLLTYFNNK